MEFIDLHKQYQVLKKEIDEGMQDVIASTHFISGAKVKELENELAAYVGVKHCLTCANGTDALTLAMQALHVTSGDAVFVPAFTFFATAEVVALEGATPIFVDVDAAYNMDPVSLEKAIDAVNEEGILRLKAIITVDLFGQPADYPKIREIADRHGLKIVEDAAQGFGGCIDGRMACSFGDISITSFFPVKPLGCYGDGGAILTNSDEDHALMASLAVHGKGEDKYDNVRIGCNSRLDTLQAAILLPKLKALRQHELDQRDVIAERYAKALRNAFVVPHVLHGFRSSWAQYSLLAKDETERKKVMSSLAEEGIPTMIYYRIPLHRQKAFANLRTYVPLPNAENYSRRIFSIPMHPYLDEKTQDRIITALLRSIQ